MRIAYAVVGALFMLSVGASLSVIVRVSRANSRRQRSRQPFGQPPKSFEGHDIEKPSLAELGEYLLSLASTYEDCRLRCPAQTEMSPPRNVDSASNCELRLKSLDELRKRLPAETQWLVLGRIAKALLHEAKNLEYKVAALTLEQMMEEFYSVIEVARGEKLSRPADRSSEEFARHQIDSLDSQLQDVHGALILPGMLSRANSSSQL